MVKKENTCGAGRVRLRALGREYADVRLRQPQYPGQRRRDGLGLAGECRAKGDRRADPLAPA